MPRRYVLKPQIHRGRFAKGAYLNKTRLVMCIHNTNNAKRGRKQALSAEQEKDLNQKITILAKSGFELSKEEIKLVVQTYVNRRCFQLVNTLDMLCV